jgi:hypothetical protein
MRAMKDKGDHQAGNPSPSAEVTNAAKEELYKLGFAHLHMDRTQIMLILQESFHLLLTLTVRAKVNLAQTWKILQH